MEGRRAGASGGEAGPPGDRGGPGPDRQWLRGGVAAWAEVGVYHRPGPGLGGGGVAREEARGLGGGAPEKASEG